MARIEATLPVGVHSKFFIGSVAATGTVLTQVKHTRTQGLGIQDATPTDYVVALERLVEGELRSVQFTVSFIGDSELTYKMANNIPLDGDVNDPPDYEEKYILFIADTASGSDKCYVFPELQVISPRTSNYNKDKVTVYPITYRGVDKWLQPSYNPIEKGTLDEMRTFLGVRDPFV